MSLPLLERGSMFEVYELKKQGIVAEYKVEAELLALNPERAKFILLSREEANRCKVDPMSC